MSLLWKTDFSQRYKGTYSKVYIPKAINKCNILYHICLTFSLIHFRICSWWFLFNQLISGPSPGFLEAALRRRVSVGGRVFPLSLGHWCHVSSPSLCPWVIYNKQQWDNHRVSKSFIESAETVIWRGWHIRNIQFPKTLAAGITSPT